MSKLPSHRNRFEIALTKQTIERLEEAAYALSTEEDGARVMDDHDVPVASRGQACRVSAIVEAGAMQLLKTIERDINRIRAKRK